MVLKTKSGWLICIIFALALGTWLAISQSPPAQTALSAHIIVINKLLLHLRQECIRGDIDNALNTMEDVKQEWEYLDMTMRNGRHFPSGNLKRLDSLVNMPAFKAKPKQHLASVLEEINAVNRKLDHK